jgi:DNA-directed RNA polymerase specialized sigma24 family protein
MQSRHNPSGNGVHHFDNDGLERLIATHQRGDPAALGEIIEQVQERARTLIRFHKTSRYKPEDELLSDVNYRLVRGVDKFDPTRGSAFTFVSALIWNTLRSNVTAARKFISRHVELDETITEKLTTEPVVPGEVIEDVAVRLRRGMKTTLSDPAELEAMRWYVDSFIGGAFELRRHQCADAAMAVYGLNHDRSRELYDLTLLEIRRLMYDDFAPRKIVPPSRLAPTRSRWAVRFSPLMTPTEFTKFAYLTRDLSPFVLFLIAPKASSRRQDRNAPVGRDNVRWILYGHPEAKPLFGRKSEA